ncbi:MAG TPA: T9SS type A sorting domain-containing protein, partial [Ignavibacteriaceae bacterium]|nr:T9SS type A sorting domain-containing protein [Ignavibacteriaceae bacterium]
INIYPGDGGQYSWTIFYTDLQWTVSTDGGVTWSTPTVLGDQLVSETYPSVARRLEVLPNGDVVAHFLYFVDPIPGQSLFNPPTSGNKPQNGNAVGDWYYYSMVVAQSSDVNENPVVANNFNLEQNYPNPFNPSTTIKYSVAERSNVNIKVYDMLGKEVASLVNTVKEAGSYEVNFNASNLASGMYVYTITAGNFTSSKKMMLMK